MSFSGFYFFADANSQAANPLDYIHAQSSADAYGPVTPAAGTADDYRVTSLHTATFNPKAYAPCNAILCVQRVDALRVNIVLKPLVQPGLNFAPVKYIVYKGVLAASLINGTDVALAATNDLTAMLHAVQARKNASAGTSATAPAEALGIALSATAGADFADTAPIGNLFYRTGVAFQLPVVKGGAWIGQFDKAGFGIEILMEGIGLRHTLATARELVTLISAPALQGGENAAQLFDHWHLKEQILGYMDPCAFYGSMFSAGVRARTSTATAFADKKGAGLYQDVLFPFANKNVAYLDIRNEHGDSLDYLGNYGRSIKVGYGGATPAITDYYADKWPILALKAASFPGPNAATGRNAFAIQLPVGDNKWPLLFVSQGYREINLKGSDFPGELKDPERLFDGFGTPAAGFTKTNKASGNGALRFAVANATGQGATTPVSCYIRLKYLKRQPPKGQQMPAAATSTAPQPANYLDNLIRPLDMTIPFGGTAPIKSFVYDEEVYFDAREVAGLEFDCIGKVGIAQDADNTSLFIVPTIVRTQKGRAGALVNLIGEASDHGGHYPNLVALKYPLERVRKSELVFSATDKAPTATFVSDAGKEDQERLSVPDFEKLVLLVVANNAFNTWVTSAASPGQGARVYLGIKNFARQADGIGVKFISFELVLRAMYLDAGTNGYALREVGTDPANSANNIKVNALAGA